MISIAVVIAPQPHSGDPVQIVERKHQVLQRRPAAEPHLGPDLWPDYAETSPTGSFPVRYAATASAAIEPAR